MTVQSYETTPSNAPAPRLRSKSLGRWAIAVLCWSLGVLTHRLFVARLVRRCRNPARSSDVSTGNRKGPSRWITPPGDPLCQVDAVSRPRINQIDQNEGQSERANNAIHYRLAVGPVQFRSPETLAARSRFKRAVLVLRMLRRPSIAAVVRPNAGPINTCGLPAAQSSSSRLSS
jgi:hypothetical protein